MNTSSRQTLLVAQLCIANQNSLTITQLYFRRKEMNVTFPFRVLIVTSSVTNLTTMDLYIMMNEDLFPTEL